MTPRTSTTQAPLKIAVTVLYLPSESKMGVGWTAHRLANEMVARGHDVTVFSPCAKPDDAMYVHRLVPLSGSGRTFKWGWELGKIDFRSFDVLHCHGDDHFVRAKHRPRVHVRTLHGSCFDEALHIRGVKERVRMVLLGLTEVVAAVRTPVIVGDSRASLRFFPWHRSVIPNGVDADALHPDGRRAELPAVLFVGTYKGRKRGAMLMDVFEREVRSAVPNAQLWMVCRDAPPAPNVEVLGRLSEEDLADRYRRAWAFVLPSSYEGFGIPYVEALAAGLPVVASPNRGARELLTGVDGCEIAADTELGAAIVRALRHGPCDPDRAGPYRWESVVAQYEGVYRG